MDSLPPTPTVIESRLDWLTMSSRDPSACASLLEWRDRRFAVLGEEGHREKSYTAYGRAFRSRAQVAIGVGRSDVIAQFSGPEAQRGFADCINWATNVSRIDLAVTGRFDTPTDTVAEGEYRAAQTAPRGRGRRSELTLILSEDRGDTLYVGSRTSDALGRLYNKWKESRSAEYTGCWRWEVQYRRGQALATARALQASQAPQAQVQATVSSWFRGRGVRAAFGSSAVPLDNRVASRPSDDERWLAWARKSVQPRAKQLVARYGWRFVAEALTGRINTYEQWETLVRDIELELIAVEE